jgi:hypothetical protein
MSLILELPPELERDLTARAAELQLPLAEYAVRVLAAGAGGNAAPKPTNGADLVAYWQAEGLVGTRPDIADPADHARMLRRDAERRTR